MKLISTNLFAQFLRRFSPAKGKPVHDAAVMIGVVKASSPVNGPDAAFDNHPSWPIKSIDGYEFTADDGKEVIYVELFAREHGDSLTTLKGEPTGEIVGRHCDHGKGKKCCGKHK